MAAIGTLSQSVHLLRRKLALNCRVEQVRHWRTVNRKLPVSKKKRITSLRRRPGLPIEKAQTLVQRLDDFYNKGKTKIEEIDIGLPGPSDKSKTDTKPSKKELKEWRENKKHIMDEARLRILEISLGEVQAEWAPTGGSDLCLTMARYYNIFKDLFGPVYFAPRVPLDIYYELDEEDVAPVHFGNRMAAFETTKAPVVQFEAPEDSLWTLVLTSPDGHLQDNTAEVLHWFVGNIPGEQVNKGETLYEYLPPFPPQGTGYLRYVFILYKQDKHIDYSEMKPSDSYSLKDRTFSSFKFYQKHEDYMTPASLAFFQCSYDDSVKEIYHNILNMREPSYEYNFPPHWHPKQKVVPHRQPFNLYLDRYRDIKDIHEEVLVEKLKIISPFEMYKPEKYPFLEPYKVPHSWQKLEVKNRVLRKGKWKDFV